MVSDGYLHDVLHGAAPFRYRAGIERLLAVTEPAPHFVVLPAVEALSFPYLHLRLTATADHPTAVATASGVAAQAFTPDDHPAVAYGVLPARAHRRLLTCSCRR